MNTTGCVDGEQAERTAKADELAQLKKELGKQRHTTISAGIAISVVVLAAGIGLWLWAVLVPSGSLGTAFGTWEIGAPALLVIIVGLVTAMVVGYIVSERRQLDERIREVDYEIDLYRFRIDEREARANKLVWANDFQLKRYYEQNLRQGKSVYWLGIVCIAIGVLVIVGTGWVVVVELSPGDQWKEQVMVTVLGTAGTIMVNYVAAIYLRMNTAITDSFAMFHGRLVTAHEVFLANLISAGIKDDDKREDALKQLSLLIAGSVKDSG